jgi:hypothetical protein
MSFISYRFTWEEFGFMFMMSIYVHGEHRIKVQARFQLLHMAKGLESLDFGGGRTKQKGIFHLG